MPIVNEHRAAGQERSYECPTAELVSKYLKLRLQSCSEMVAGYRYVHYNDEDFDEIFFQFKERNEGLRFFLRILPALPQRTFTRL